VADLHPLLGLYRLLIPVTVSIMPVAAPFSEKLRKGLSGRRGFWDRVAASRERLQRCIWIHVTSVGEYEQARPVIAALKARHGDSLPIAVTHFSPSGLEYAQKRPCADFHDYLPFDRLSNMHRLAEAWAPRLLIFIKFDYWPNQVRAAHGRGVPIVLLAGTLQPRSARLWAPARSLFRNLFTRFDHLGVCSAEDEDRFRHQIGVSCPITVTGDTRAEQVILRYESAAASPEAQQLTATGRSFFILGSTWPPDERLWLPVLPDLLRRFPKLTGILADIYRAARPAYVGGTFTTGVHNTMDPAIAAMPVLFGPVIQNANEAGHLLRLGAGFVVKKSTEALERAGALLQDPEDLTRRGLLARQFVLDQRGATEKSLAVLDPYL